MPAILYRSLAGLALVAALAAAGCSSSSKHSPPAHHSSSTPTKNGIPQGNVGDNDADNHGGPSDGDGNI
jgi:hypothetical protein